MTQDRYPLELDCRPIVHRLAETYHTGPYWKVTPTVKAQWQHESLRAFDKLLGIVSVKFIKEDCEPYATAEEMASRIRSESVFLVRWRHPGSHPLGSAHSMFRAVHDYFGHVVGQQPFTMDGELACYNIHASGSMFSKATLPLVWSEVVLENAYRLWHGHWYWHSKPVFDPQWGQVQWHELEDKQQSAASAGTVSPTLTPTPETVI